jgi:hypothetical protein
MADRAVCVHHLAHAQAALAAAATCGRQVTLLSAPAAGTLVGPQFFAELVRQARATHPEAATGGGILDCDRAAGRALAAIRLGFEGIVYTGSLEIQRKLADAAEPYGCAIHGERPRALDLAEVRGDPAAALTRWLTKG